MAGSGRGHQDAAEEAARKALQQLHVPGGALHGELSGCYKIKLRKQGVRLIYAVEDDWLIVTVLAVDRREKLAAYEAVIGQMMAAARRPAASRKA